MITLCIYSIRLDYDMRVDYDMRWPDNTPDANDVKRHTCRKACLLPRNHTAHLSP